MPARRLGSNPLVQLKLGADLLQAAESLVGAWQPCGAAAPAPGVHDPAANVRQDPLHSPGVARGTLKLIRSIKQLGRVLQPSRRLLGLDVGDRRVGVSVSNRERTTARPVSVYLRSWRSSLQPSYARDEERAIQAVSKLVAQYEAHALVVGLPLTLDGEVGPQAVKTQLFVRKLLAHGLAAEYLYFADERYVSEDVEELLGEKMGRRDRLQFDDIKDVKDMYEAQYILQDVLDQLNYKDDDSN